MADYLALIASRRELLSRLTIAFHKLAFLRETMLPRWIRDSGGEISARVWDDVVEEIRGICEPVDQSMLDAMAQPGYDPERSYRYILASLPPARAVGHGHEPHTAIDAIWRIGQFVSVGYRDCITIWKDDLKVVPDQRAEITEQFFASIFKYPNPAVYRDRLDTEEARLLTSEESLRHSGAAGPLPVPILATIHEEDVKQVPPEPAEAPYLGLTLDGQTLSRKGFGSVELSKGAQVDAVKAMLKSRGSDIDKEQMQRNIVSSTASRIDNIRTRLNKKLPKLGVCVVERSWWIAEANVPKDVPHLGRSSR